MITHKESLTSFEFPRRKKYSKSNFLIIALRDAERKLVHLIKARANIVGDAERKAMEEKDCIFRIYLILGHINLLAEDFVRALSAYQKAYNHKKDDFWRDPSALYGLGVCYYHFRTYRPVIELFCQLLFSHPHTANSILADVHARLGLSFKSVDNIPLALKHLTIAFEDGQEECAFPKHFLRFQIAHCFDISGDVRKAVEEYRKLIDDSAVAKFGNQLLAAIYCRLGWISLCAREREPQEHQYQKLKDAEKLLCKAREFSPTDSKANCYLGLCYSEQRRELAKKAEEEPQNTPNGQQQHIHQPRYNADQAAQNAFVSYRTAIDSDESDANIWRSIGVLYQQQNQPIDALQAFACAVQLNDRHFGAWLDLGHLYENHRQYAEALAAYIKALKASTEPPEQLRTRIFAIEHELSQIGGPKNYSLLLHQQHQTNRRSDLILLPTIENAWQLGIPAQVRQRLADLKNHTVLNYREGSPLWSMQELIADSMQMDSPIASNKLTPTQRQILQILKINKDQFEGGSLETTLLRELEQRVPSPSPADDRPMNGERNATSPAEGPMAETAAASQRLNQLESPSAFSKCDRRPSPSTLASPTASSSLQQHQQELPLPSSMMSPKEEVTMEEDEENESPSTSHQYHRHHKHQIQEEKISSSTSFSSDLPPNFSLLAPVHVPVTVSSEEIFDLCKKRVAKPDEYFLAPIFDEDVPPPRRPIPSQTPMLKDKLLLKTPLVLVENQKDASAIELQQYCYNQPIVLIHGLTMALKIDLSQFSTKTLIQTAPEHEVEVRTQYKMPSYDVNLDQMGEPTWAIRSSKSWSTISRYGQYQAESFRHSLKEETEKLRQANPKLFQQQTPTTSEVPTADNVSPVPSKKRKATAATAASMAAGSGTPTGRGRVEESGSPYKIIKFGTNIDLSDERKFYAQLKELNKLPAFCRLHSASNMLSYLGHTVYGMNTVQLYLKVPGCRTPGHLENNSFASINVNIGPGECEWFGVPYEYWPGLENMCKDRSIDFLRGAWWPGVTDLIKADVPFYRFTQKAGDVVWVNGGCVHWVQSTGWCNNVAWNVGPMTANQLEMALQAHEWNRLNSYQSLVPMQHLCWSLARDVRFTNQKLFNLVKHMLIRSLAYCQMLVDYVAVALKSPIKKQQRQKGECAHYCHLCEVEVFNILFVKEIGGKWKIFCVQCARRSQCFNDHVVLQQYSFEELSSIFDRFQLYPAKPALIC